MTLPDPDALHPMPAHPRVVHLRPLAKDRPNVTVGQFAYYDDPDDATAFFDRNVLHHHDFLGDHLTIGRFAAIASGARIVMNGANHDMLGVSTYPFDVFPDWGSTPDLDRYRKQSRGDTVIGPDVWIGAEAWIMPGITIGAGAIVASRAVVTRDVAPYVIVGGNPATSIRQRFDDAMIARLLEVAWWDWPTDRIQANIGAIRGTDIEALETAR
ncbi:virginiamycin A acetyltransferase [Aliiruegeria haliotis]|uniref:Virginiamycin A acetyltransferase n=1 Tax=Aliiruegeria haliotis TaxID=1280846 RepID=A0A2T0RJ51_9RHOB|nr:CatB-related O-acetyltransferase [Aliiruegeria haliotis]PRY21140.1 virginiamycin A acetyltransferase [Aliiruegeria haliotis]